MLNIPEGLKEEFLTDSVNKNIVIPFIDGVTDVSGVNWYTGWVAYGITGHLDNPGDLILYCNYDGDTWDNNLKNYAYTTYLNDADYIYVSCKLTISAYTVLPTQMGFACHYKRQDGSSWGGNEYYFNPNDYITELTSADGLRLYTRLPGRLFKEFKELAIYCKSGGVDMTYGIGDIQIQSSNVLYSDSDFYNHNNTNPLPYLGEDILLFIHVLRGLGCPARDLQLFIAGK